MKNIVLFGPPGAGKGTQAEKIKLQYDLFHISTGDVFRYNIKNSTKLGLLAKSYMDNGDLVPDEVTINMLNDVVDKNLNENGFIFDGFPRTESQAIALEKLLNNYNTSIAGMIALEVDDEILISRLLERGKLSGRADDSNRDIIENRIKEYYNKTAILKTFYQRKNCYFGVNGVGQIDEITSRIIEIMSRL
tara:strand:- start:1138 stop:1710 length:573 start_codon:yes stop_codon:yes gene_type:complete